MVTTLPPQKRKKKGKEVTICLKELTMEKNQVGGYPLQGW